MRKILMIAGAVAMATSMPALAKDKGGHGGGHGGGKPEKQQSRGNGGGGKAAKAEFRGGGNGNKSAERSAKQAEKRFDQRQRFAEKRSESRAKQAEKRFERREKVAEKAEKRFEKQRERRAREIDRRAERFVDRDDRRDLRRIRGDDRFDDRFDDRRDGRYRNLYANDYADCPPGLARKNNGCLPPGQARKMFRPSRVFAAGQLLPMSYYGDYNIPYEYQNWYRDTPDYYYRYDDGGYIYQVDRGSNLVESLIPLLGGGFGVGQMLPVGYDTYNLPMAYRDDYIDSDEAYYRYGDDAIYQVDPQTNMIESIVALLAGDLNVGGMLPGGYDTYNLPMDYRDQYVDSDDSMYRYADGNIYQIDPQSMIIEQIVASLV